MKYLRLMSCDGLCQHGKDLPVKWYVTNYIIGSVHSGMHSLSIRNFRIIQTVTWIM